MGQSVAREIADAASVPIQTLGSLEAVDARDAQAFIEASAQWARRRIVAVEGFTSLAGGAYQPVMDWILDLSALADPAACREEAQAFVDDAPDDLVFVFDVEQLPDPGT
jgi:hypothetical protein